MKQDRTHWWTMYLHPYPERGKASAIWLVVISTKGWGKENQRESVVALVGRMLLVSLAVTVAPALGPSDSCRLQSLRSMQAKGLDCRPALAEHITVPAFCSLALEQGENCTNAPWSAEHVAFVFKKASKNAFLNTVQGITYCGNPSCVSAGTCGAVL